MKKSVIGSAIVLGFAVAIAAPSIGGCGSQGNSGSPGNPAPVQKALGTVGLELTLPGGETITNVNWTINQGATVVLSGTYAVPASATSISFFIPNVPSGSGYTITLSATSPDGSVSCAGTSAPFSVTAQTTTDVNVFLTCTSSSSVADAGGVQVNATPVECATWTSASATPATQTAGSAISLAASAVGPNSSAVTYAWSATTPSDGGVLSLAGQIAAPTSALTTFTCPSTPAVVTITLTVGDGALPTGATCPVASSTTTLTVTCGAVPCVGVGTGVEASPDTATGTCPSPSINTGTLKDSSGNFCCSPAPCQGVGIGVAANPPTSATGTCPAGDVNTGTLKDSSGNYCCSTLVPCTTAGQTGCVACQGSTGGVCTPTEATLVQLDINKGFATAAGNDPAAGCYTCLLGKHGLDDTTGDTGNECGDLTGTTASTDPAGCIATLSCIVTSGCALASTYLGDAGTNNSLNDCYCGTAPASGTCTSGGANGPCDSVEATGLGFAETDGLDILKNFTLATLASGQANTIIQYAMSNSCTQCIQ
ncbi:MAG: hypothetical protein ACLQVI_36365 [Polyangiaceae bacterium]